MPTDVLIVGGGPAGMSAAIETASHGLNVELVDEGSALGGQIYRQPTDRARKKKSSSFFYRGDELRELVQQYGKQIKVHSKAVVWGVSKDIKVAVGEEVGGTRFIQPKKLIFATGAYEYVPPFPGWTLPGIMTAGAAQILVKTMDVSPGKRVVIAGTGPLLYLIACQLIDSGVTVIAVLEATAKWQWAKLLPHSLNASSLVKEGLGYMYKLRRAGVPIHYRRVVTKALGDGELQSVTHAPVDADWYPDRDREETIEADTLCVHYGLQPRSYLAQLAGCDLVFSEQKQAWTLVHDEYMRTSHEDILAAGDGSDIAGAITAEHEGRIAGLEVARQLGRIDSPTFTTKYRSHADQIKKLAPFQNTLSLICRIRPGLTTLIEDDTIVCRCEEVRWGDAKAAIEHGGTNFRTLKVMTRLGMGMCQARFCWPAMSRTLAEHKGCSVGEIGLARPQAPVLPVSLGVIAAMPESDKTGNT